MQRAVGATRSVGELARQKEVEFRSHRFAGVYHQAQILCPLKEPGECLIFEQRPLACRLFDLPVATRQEFLGKPDQELDDISHKVYFAFTSSFLGNNFAFYVKRSDFRQICANLFPPAVKK